MLHNAILKGNLNCIRRLVKLGAKTSDQTNYTVRGQITPATALNLPIHLTNPETLVCLMQSSDINVSMSTKCTNGKDKDWTCLDLAIHLAREKETKNAMLVSILRFHSCFWII